jgi:hypothetical protein
MRPTEERSLHTDEREPEATPRDDGDAERFEAQPDQYGQHRADDRPDHVGHDHVEQGSADLAVDSTSQDRAEGFTDQAPDSRTPDSADRTEVLVDEPSPDRTDEFASSDQPDFAEPTERSPLAPPDAVSTDAVSTDAEATAGGQLLGDEDSAEFRTRWIELQGSFVDDPRQAVQQAEGLVDEVMQTLIAQLTARKEQLEARSSTSGDSSGDTEELRLRLRSYREFFEQMLKR